MNEAMVNNMTPEEYRDYAASEKARAIIDTIDDQLVHQQSLLIHLQNIREAIGSIVNDEDVETISLWLRNEAEGLSVNETTEEISERMMTLQDDLRRGVEVSLTLTQELEHLIGE
ncbi:hypothetical protein [Endozoicomonas ascidiicola]|uniref:hypothetical protein n=1 Tax=Endozoicomonas ascidiicola TaxID=1698521 RepID=UPI0008378D4C|nr:hypothetical protein [Endozoicomonas ascidiicola]